MRFTKIHHRWQRITLRLLVIVAAVVLMAGLFINFYFSPILSNKIKSTVLTSSDSLYKVNFTNAYLHFFQGKIVIYNIDLLPDTSVYNQRKKTGTEPNNLYRVHIKKLVLSHIHPFSLYFKKRLNVDEIIVSAPELNITYQLNRTRDTVEKDSRTLYQRISKTLHSIHVGRIGLNDVQFKYADYSGNKVAISELKEMNLTATDLLIDSASMTDRKRFLYCADVTTELNNFSGRTLNGLYNYRMKLLKMSSSSSQLTAEDINLQPVNPAKFFDKSTHDRFSVHIDSLQLNNFDFLTYHKYRRFSAQSMVLSKGKLSVFSNPNLNPKLANKDRVVTFPNAGIYKLKTDLRLDTVRLKHIDITYTEFNKKSLKMGYVDFNNTSGQILNLTTNSAVLQKNKYCNIALTSYLMNKGKLNVRFKFDLADQHQLSYSYSGHLSTMKLSAINKAAMPLAMVKINSGTAQSFDFAIDANRNRSRGRVSILYNDLKVTVLKADTSKNKLKHLTLESLYANIFILKHNNPDAPGETPRSYYVDNVRPPEDAFFKTVWKTLLTGVRQCVGYGMQKEQEVKNKMAERVNKKEERQAKKAKRKARRAERKKQRQLRKQLKAANSQ